MICDERANICQRIVMNILYNCFLATLYIYICISYTVECAITSFEHCVNSHLFAHIPALLLRITLRAFYALFFFIFKAHSAAGLVSVCPYHCVC